MSGSTLRFCHVGYGYIICANRVVAVFPPGAEPTKRMMRNAKTNGIFIDMTRGNETKSYLLMEDGAIIAVAFNPLTIQKRLNEDPSVRTRKTLSAKDYDDEAVDDGYLDGGNPEYTEEESEG